MKDDRREQMLTQRRKGAKARTNSFAVSLCASAPLRELFAGMAVLVYLAVVNGAALAEDSPVETTAKSWPLGRGNSLADGVAKTTLPDKPEVLWKVTVEKGAFDGTPVIAGGVGEHARST